jgi:hypothetical protein
MKTLSNREAHGSVSEQKTIPLLTLNFDGSPVEVTYVPDATIDIDQVTEYLKGVVLEMTTGEPMHLSYAAPQPDTLI